MLLTFADAFPASIVSVTLFVSIDGDFSDLAFRVITAWCSTTPYTLFQPSRSLTAIQLLSRDIGAETALLLTSAIEAVSGQPHFVCIAFEV